MGDEGFDRVANDTTAAAGLANGIVKIFNIAIAEAEKAELASYQSAGAAAGALAFTPDSASAVAGAADKNIAVWVLPPAAPKTLAGHTGQIYCVALSPDGKLAATAAADKSAKIWDVAKGPQRFARWWCPRTSSMRSPSIPRATSWPPAATTSWSSSGTPPTARSCARARATAPRSMPSPFAPTAAKLASGSVDKTIRIWNVADGKEVHKLDGHPDDVYSVAFSPDGKRLASVGYGGNLYVWDAGRASPSSTSRSHRTR